MAQADEVSHFVRNDVADIVFSGLVRYCEIVVYIIEQDVRIQNRPGARAGSRDVKVACDGDGTRVEIVHDLTFRIRPLAWLAEPIIGGFFIENVAAKTLRTFKQIVENRPGEKGL